jgi:hypothetical protein
MKKLFFFKHPYMFPSGKYFLMDYNRPNFFGIKKPFQNKLKIGFLYPTISLSMVSSGKFVFINSNRPNFFKTKKHKTNLFNIGFSKSTRSLLYASSPMDSYGGEKT